jgi:NAD(P) transhydrogenase subunit alpha
MPARVAMNASQMYANNLTNLVDEFWNKEKKEFELKLDDDIIKGCLITHGGIIVHPSFMPHPDEKKFHKG